MRDTHYRVEAPGSAVAEETAKDWSARSKRFFEELVDDSVELQPPTKMQRVCAFDWAKAVDWKLQVMTGHGLAAMQPVENDARSIQDRSHLSLVLDKGSDGFSAVWALLNKYKLRQDPSIP